MGPLFKPFNIGNDCVNIKRKMRTFQCLSNICLNDISNTRYIDPTVISRLPFIFHTSILILVYVGFR